MNTVFLMDVSINTSLGMNMGAARFISRHFRPGDGVILFDDQALALDFRGNPTYEDIMNVARRRIGACTGLPDAIFLALKLYQSSRKIIIGSGAWTENCPHHPYEEILLTESGKRK